MGNWLVGILFGALAMAAWSKYDHARGFEDGYAMAEAKYTEGIDGYCTDWWFNADPRRLREARFYICGQSGRNSLVVPHK